ncbi:MAG TPA: sulfotransferase, partial [Myxococcota bacterium]|nr:sulfotransferase [Myxococcota bacterium]
VRYADLVADPGGTAGRIYAALGWRFTSALRHAVVDYVAIKPRGARGVHHYSLEEFGLDPAVERDRFAFYRDHFGVAEER